MAVNNSINYRVLDEDNMASDSATAVATQQSIKAYADAQTGGSGAFELVTATTVSSPQSAVTFTGFDGTYYNYQLVMINVVPVSDGDVFVIEMSNDNGATYETASGDYNWVSFVNSAATTTDSNSDLATATYIQLARYCGNAGQFSGELWLLNPTNSSFRTGLVSNLFVDDHTGAGAVPVAAHYTGGQRNTAEDNDAIQVRFVTDDISSGIFMLYGIRGA